MNDEELRAFLDAATVGENGQSGKSSAGDDATEAQGDTPDSALPRRNVPSFDELMNMGMPDEQPEPQSAAEQPDPRPAAEPPETAPAPQVAEASEPSKGEWSQSYAEDDEELVPLILPGFSPEPKSKPPLPPVFQAEPAARPDDDDEAEAHIEPAPTQPYDVVSEADLAPAADTIPAATPKPAAATRPEPKPGAASVPAQAPTREPDREPASHDDNPFATLAPELLLDGAFGSSADDPAEGASGADDNGNDGYERIAVTGSEPKGRKAMPWIIVGAGVVIAIIASIFVINGVRGSGEPEPTTAPPATTTPTPEPTTPSPEPTEEPEPEPAESPAEPPAVDPGDIYELPISQWGVTVDRSNRLGGSTPYTLSENDTRLTFDHIPVADGLSDACAAAREPNVWGLLRNGDTYEVIRPEPRCADPADAAVYDMIWGLMDHMGKTVKPIG